MQLSVYRRDNRKRDGGLWRRRLRLVVLAALLLLIAFTVYRWRGPFGAAAQSARAFVLENPYFAVREIQVRGGEKVGGSEIVAMAGLRHGMNMWKIDAADIEKKVAKHPWVRRVVVRREFPRRVVIDVEERAARGIVALGKLYYVDSDGLVFKEVGAGESVDFPLLTGFRADDLNAANPANRKRVQDALRLGDLMTQDSHAVSEIHFDPPDGLVVYTTAHPTAFQMGWGDWENKLKRLDRVLDLWKGNEERLGSVDVSFRDQAVVRVRQPRRQ